MSTDPISPPAPPQRTFLGHPLGLYVLFFTEMWERFSYYGMRALLVLYMLDHFKYTQREASAVYKWYTSLVYLTPLLGGFLADRYLGNKWAVIIGAVLMAIGQFLLTFEPETIFYIALVFMILGNGFFKPNMSTQVGRLYPQNDPRRDGAYTIFYMGINLGAFLSPLVCGWLALNTIGGRHTGFMAAGIGMLLGLIVYLVGLRWVIELKPERAAAEPVTADDQPVRVGGAISEEKANQTPSAVPMLNRIAPALLRLAGYALLIVSLGLGAVRIVLAVLAARQSDVPSFLNTVSLSRHIANDTLVSLGIVAVCALISAWVLGYSRGALRDRVLTIFVLGIFVVFFWAAFEQAGNALNVWADKATNRYMTQSAPLPPLYPEMPAAAPRDKGREGEEDTAAVGSGLTRWVNMWELKPSKAPDPVKKSKTPPSRWAWFADLWNPVATEWFQSINALAIFLLAPIFAWLWTYLDRRGLNPSVPMKMAIGLLFISLAFGLMLIAAERENGPTSVSFSGPLPSQIKLSSSNQLCEEDKTGLKPYQSGRLSYDKESQMLHMTGVLPDTERDRIVRDTAPQSFVKTVKELQQKSNDKDRSGPVSVTLDPVPRGFDMRYTGLDASKLRYDAQSHTLTAVEDMPDKDVKALLVAAGEPSFRKAMDSLYQESAVHRVSPWWLFWFYIIATLAELCLSPVGLSMVSKLAPAQFATMLMGLWLLTSFFGNFAAGAFGERWGEWTPTEYFLYIMALLGGAALVLFILVRKIGTMMHGVR
jgi:dipeptide/tripeptide permease